MSKFIRAAGRRGRGRGRKTHGVVEVHVVGDDVDVGMEDAVLPDHLLQHVAHSGGEDQQRNLAFMESVKEHFVAVP